ncbi:MAG: hypothetical protein JSR93_04380 [Verrucomicrobia bacterium]|nr:hypothetical protein [Verrucomicrobiota bacterium]
MKSQSVALRQFIGKRNLKIAALFAIFFSLALFCTGCHNGSDEPLTQLQIREIQSRTFAARDAKVVIKEMINVLQDDAFIVKHANLELGLLSAEKDIDVENGWSRFFSVMASSRDARWKKNCLVEISANVTQFGDETRVRVNFQQKLFDNFGRVMKVHPIYDVEYYQEFFSKVSKGLFIQEEKI